MVRKNIGRRHLQIDIYAPDYDEYLSNDRGMYINIYSLPSPVSKTTEELIRSMKNYDKEKYMKLEEKLVESVGYYGGDAAATVANRIIDRIQGDTREGRK